MKRVWFVFVAVLILSLCACDEFYVTQHVFSRDSLDPIKPNGLVFGEKAGQNWWEGTYKGKPVLIHAVQYEEYVNVEFQYIDTFFG